jgi:hypothetical protein
MTFRDRIRELDPLLQAISLNVLVWGPAPGAGPDGKKRQDVRDRLTATFPHSDVVFSEELADLPPDSPDLSLPDRELYHLTLSDICIVLDTSAGAAAEIAHFTRSKQSKKLYILTHEKYKGVATFPAAVRQRGYQVFYSQTEYDSCNLIGRIIARVKYVALGRATDLL